MPIDNMSIKYLEPSEQYFASQSSDDEIVVAEMPTDIGMFKLVQYIDDECPNAHINSAYIMYSPSDEIIMKNPQHNGVVLRSDDYPSDKLSFFMIRVKLTAHPELRELLLDPKSHEIAFLGFMKLMNFHYI